MNQTHTTLKMIFDRWNSSLLNFEKSLNALSDEQLFNEIAPGKNRGIYILGHLIAVHDDMIQLLDMGNKLYPELHNLFIKNADKAIAEIPSPAQLRQYWSQQCSHLKNKFDTLTPEQWFDKHTAVSFEDFEKEPHRNKLNIILTRTTHLNYHTGQFILLLNSNNK